MASAPRLLTLTVPGLEGPDAPILESFRGVEGLSRPFEFHLQFYSQKTDLAAADLVGKNVTVLLHLLEGGERPFNGYIRKFAGAGTDENGYRSYRAEMVSWLWFLTRTSNSRIFENQTTEDILLQVIGESGFPNEIDITGERATGHEREFCVQYRETNFNFISRLMEEEGIFYFFKHDEGTHSLVVSDDTSAYQDCASPSLAYTEGNTVNADVTHWDHGYEFISGRWAQQDFNFETPSTSLLTNTNTKADVPGAAQYEMFDYPGAYDRKPSDGNVLTRIRMEEEEALHDAVEGVSINRTLFPSGTVSMDSHPIDAESGKGYVLVSVSHDAWDHSQTTAGGATGYNAQVVCIPEETPFRPPRITPKPTIHGLQTAIVTGPDGEEISTDEYGRVKVLFHWDREAKASCWIRVAQSIAGNQWGSIYLPRIGQEVVVSFLEGDPDRPLITGSVYNADNMPPYTLDDNKTQSGYKSRSTLDGDFSTFNELRFEDKKDQEEVYFHAQKDYNRVVEHDDSLQVGNDQTIEIQNDRTETVKQGNEKVTIEQGDRTITVQEGDDTLTVSMGDHSIEVSQGKSTTEAMQSIELKVGGCSVKIDQSSITGQAVASIELTVGSSSVKLDPSGVTIKGMMVTIDADTQAEVQGGAMVSVSGALVKIN